MFTWLYAVICSQALFQTERGGRGYTCYHVYPPTYTHTNMYTHTHMYMSPTYICSVHMFTCTRIHIYIRVHMFTGHTNTCASDHCTPVSISGVHSFCHVRKLVRMFTRDCAYELARICTSFVSTCSCVLVYVCSYIHMFTCTQLLICSRVHLYIGPSWLRVYLLTYVHRFTCHHIFQTLFPSSERKAGCDEMPYIMPTISHINHIPLRNIHIIF